MKNFRNCLLLLTVFFVFDAVAQIDFVPAYYIDNDNNKVECLIKDRDWLISPDSVYYMLDDSSEVFTFGVEDVSVFQVSSSKYVRCKALIDQSKSNIDELSLTKTPEFEEKVVFLKVLLEGEKTLLYYYGDGLKRFFLETDGEIVPLICKAYTPEPGVIGQNDNYKGQLAAYLGVDEDIRRRIAACAYSRRSLVGIFELYHEVICDECVSYKKKRHQVMYVSPSFGTDVAYLNLQEYYSGLSMSVTSLFFGAEWEYIIPVSNGAWSIFITPTVQLDVKSSAEYDNSPWREGVAAFDFDFIKVPVGLRYHYHISEDVELAFDASISKHFSWRSDFIYGSGAQSRYLFKENFLNCSFGCGFVYHDFITRASFNGSMWGMSSETSTSNLSTGYPATDVRNSSYKSVSLSLAYRFQISE